MKVLLRHRLVLISLQALLLAQQSARDWQEISLPKCVQTEQKFIDIPAGWEGVDDEKGLCQENVRNLLIGISFYNGHPIECAHLMPTEKFENKSKKIVL